MLEIVGYFILGLFVLWIIGYFTAQYIANKAIGEDVFSDHQCDDYFTEKWNSRNNQSYRDSLDD